MHKHTESHKNAIDDNKDEYVLRTLVDRLFADFNAFSLNQRSSNNEVMVDTEVQAGEKQLVE